MRILFISSEVVPFAKTGGLADVSGILPQALNNLKANCSIVLPLYRAVRKNGFKPELVKSDIPVQMGDGLDTFNLRHLKQGTTDVYFIEKDEYYDRDHIYGTPQGDHPDNALRYSFFSKAALYTASQHIGRVDLLHLNDWQTALIPLYLRLYHKDDPNLSKTKTFFSIHNLAYQGLFEKEVMPTINLPDDLYNMNALEFYGKISFMKAGILYSDAIGTVSEGYAREILTPEFGCGLDGLLMTRKDDLYGILNGTDYSVWDPSTDKFICKNYSPSNIEPKKDCKKDLIKAFGIAGGGEKPIIGMVTRLAEQKGVDIVADSMQEILALGAHFVILGTGDEKYNRMFEKIEKLHKDEVGVKITFSEPLAHKVEAGADIFLIPSRYEPCGLNQMYSLKYATVPVVRAVGGLDDTIEEFDPSLSRGNGFKFEKASKKELLLALGRAIKVYHNKKVWQKLQKNCMSYDFSWGNSAKKYIAVYRKVLSKK